MVLTEEALINVGLDNVLEFLELEDKIQLKNFMLEVGIVFLAELADYLAQHGVVLCEYCALKLVNAYTDPEPYCTECLDMIYAKF